MNLAKVSSSTFLNFTCLLLLLSVVTVQSNNNDTTNTTTTSTTITTTTTTNTNSNNGNNNNNSNYGLYALLTLMVIPFGVFLAWFLYYYRDDFFPDCADPERYLADMAMTGSGVHGVPGYGVSSTVNPPAAQYPQVPSQSVENGGFSNAAAKLGLPPPEYDELQPQSQQQSQQPYPQYQQPQPLSADWMAGRVGPPIAGQGPVARPLWPGYKSESNKYLPFHSVLGHAQQRMKN